MSFFNDLQNLDRNNVGGWPQSVKVFFTALVCVVVLLAGWYFFVSNQQDDLNQLVVKENSLKHDFAAKQAKSVNLEALQHQLDEMQDMLRQLLRQLPSKTEMPELLIDISQTAQSAGLETDVFEPGPETPKDFYAESRSPCASAAPTTSSAPSSAAWPRCRGWSSSPCTMSR
jgi:type IV pilus assembly protein PilO